MRTRLLRRRRAVGEKYSSSGAPKTEAVEREQRMHDELAAQSAKRS
jgi:hypothetical protein